MQPFPGILMHLDALGGGGGIGIAVGFGCTAQPAIAIENIDISNLRIKYLPMRIGGISYSALLNLVLYYVHKLLKNISRGTW
jgi:hypothetical protein